MQYRIGEPSNFHQIHHIYVFWRSDCEYDDKYPQIWFSSSKVKKCFQKVISFYMDNYWSSKKTFPKKVVKDEKIYL